MYHPHPIHESAVKPISTLDFQTPLQEQTHSLLTAFSQKRRTYTPGQNFFDV